MTKECDACKGKGEMVPYLGSVERCAKCGGSGQLEVPPEPLSPWQEEVVMLLRAILVTVAPPPARPHPPADLKPMDCFEEVSKP